MPSTSEDNAFKTPHPVYTVGGSQGRVKFKLASKLAGILLAEYYLSPAQGAWRHGVVGSKVRSQSLLGRVRVCMPSVLLLTLDN